MLQTVQFAAKLQPVPSLSTSQAAHPATTALDLQTTKTFSQQQ